MTNKTLVQKPVFFLSFFVLFLLSSCKTTKKTIASPSNLDNDKLENALLWRIEGTGIEQPSYLYGTIHMIGAEDYFLPEGTLSAFDKAKKIVFEIDMKELTDMSTIMGLMDKAMMSDNTTLKSLLSDTDYKIVEDHFKKIGLPLIILGRLKPMFLSAFASGEMDPMGMQNGTIKSYEMEFMEMAEQAGKNTGGLETIDYQISIFDSIPYKEQAKILVKSIKNSNTGSDDFEEMVKLYKNQNITGMVSMMKDDETVSNFEDILLHDRNANWINPIIQMMKEGPTFFAVGAGHLGGPKGVINLLKKRGLKLTPLSQKTKK